MTGPADPEGRFHHSGFLSSLARDDGSALLALGRTVRFHRDATIFSEGDVSGRVVIIIRGRVKVSSDLSEGREVVLAIRGPGDLIGDLSAIDDRPHSATCTSMEPVEALAMSSATFLDYLVDHPRVALHLLRMLAGRLRDADRKRIEFGARDTLGRVAARLVELAEQFGTQGGNGAVIDLPFSQQELAGWIRLIARVGREGAVPDAGQRLDRDRTTGDHGARSARAPRTRDLTSLASNDALVVRRYA